MKTHTAIHHPTQLIDQPTDWSRLYFLPQTHYVKRQRAANAHEYNLQRKESPPDHRSPDITPVHESRFRRFLRHERKIFDEACSDTWIAIKEAGRAMTRWLTWKVVFPLSVASAVWIPSVSPMELAW